MMKQPRSNAAWAGLAILLAACGAEEPPRLPPAGPRPAEISRQVRRPGKTGAVLAASGRQSFQGAAPCRCMPHEDRGVQFSFRTGDPDLPAVAVRIEEYDGGGPYQARLFVTGRSRAGALVTSPGEVSVRLSERSSREGVLLGGSFSGAYGGPAGRGSIEGRFDGCRYPARRGASSPAGPAAAP